MNVVAFRHAAYDTPWWANPNSRDGRFHRANEAPTQYLCTHPLGPAAELLRHHLGPAGAADVDTARLDLWAAVVDIEGFVPLDFDDCAGRGIEPEDLVGDDYRPTQAVADAIRAGGASGIVSHSAALPGTRNLVIFGPRILHPYAWVPTFEAEIPTGHLSDWARPAREVIPYVRWVGHPHSALEQWRATGGYTPFDDPPVVRR